MSENGGLRQDIDLKHGQPVLKGRIVDSAGGAGNPPDQPDNVVQKLAVSRVARQREIGFVLAMVLGYTVMWILISGRMNYLMRFQYAIVPIVLLSWPALNAWHYRPWTFRAF